MDLRYINWRASVDAPEERSQVFAYRLVKVPDMFTHPFFSQLDVALFDSSQDVGMCIDIDIQTVYGPERQIPDAQRQVIKEFQLPAEK
jgi:hypothetical protein